jgi:hypothetical protein
MKVYVVSSINRCSEGCKILKVFASLKKAEKFADEYSEESNYSFDWAVVDEMDLEE